MDGDTLAGASATDGRLLLPHKPDSPSRPIAHEPAGRPAAGLDVDVSVKPDGNGDQQQSDHGDVYGTGGEWRCGACSDKLLTGLSVRVSGRHHDRALHGDRRRASDRLV
jgi:hypothetical protein